MQRIAGLLRSLLPVTDPMTPLEVNRRAREVVDAIDNETGSRTAHSQRVAQLYAVARQIQHAAEAGAKDMTAHAIVRFLADVCVRSYLPRLAAR
jgi:hypothetical protein